MACGLDQHPQIELINEMLKKDPPATYGQVRDAVLLHEEVPPARHTLSRHALGCLKMAPRTGGRPREEQALKLGERAPATAEVRDLALRIFYAKMQQRPEDVKLSELSPILVALIKLEEGKARQDNVDEMLDQLKSASRE